MTKDRTQRRVKAVRPVKEGAFPTDPSKIRNDIHVSVSANQVFLTQWNVAEDRLHPVMVMPEQIDLLIQCLQEAKAEIDSAESASAELYVVLRSTLGS
jgi:hypothetical protein